MNTKTKNPHAVALGRKGGRAKSEAKKQSGRANLEKARAEKRHKMMVEHVFCWSPGCEHKHLPDSLFCANHQGE